MTASPCALGQVNGRSFAYQQGHLDTSTYRVDTSVCYGPYVLELAILGLLKRSPMHGYDLRKRMRDDFGPMANLSFGSLYPALARLEAAGAVAAVVPLGTRAGRADLDVSSPPAMTGSLTGERAALMARRATAKAAAALGGRSPRARKVYEITAEGEVMFERLLDAPDTRGEEARSFALRLAFARHLTPPARIRLLERRRIQLADRLTEASRGLDDPRHSRDRYERAIAEHARATIAGDLAWVEELLAEEIAEHARETTASAGDVAGAETAATDSTRITTTSTTTTRRNGR